MIKPESERRRTKRLPLQVPVTVIREDGTSRKCPTEDISAGGVFLYCDLDLPKDSPIELVMVLSPEITGGERRWVCCHGRITRVLEGAAGGKRGIAVNVERLHFLPEITS